MWVWPTGAAAVAAVAALILGEVRPERDSALGTLWPGGTTTALTMLQVVAASTITVTTLTFTLTVVALQLASQQFSPRLMREFVHDPVTKRTLTVLVATFVYSLVVMRALHPAEPVPTLAVAGALILGLVTLAAVLGYITHIVRALRVDTMMLAVHDDTDRAIGLFYPNYSDPRPHSPAELDLHDEEGSAVPARRSGFLLLVDVEGLVSHARDHDVVVRLEVRPGDHIVRGTPIATVWRSAGSPPRTGDADALADGVDGALTVGYERTVQQDVSFGFRQLEDIAVKAMSPAINDPVTAAHAVGYMADLLVKLAGCRLGPTLHRDDDGVGRAIVPDRDLEYYVELGCGQLRRFASAEPSVLIALLRMLRDLATAVRDEQQAAVVRRAAESIVATVDPSMRDADAQGVRDMCRRVIAALDGHVREAYWDRAGETRSM
jgi:uncharacterized membrane protein